MTRTHIHEIDFLSDDGRTLLAEIDMSVTEMLEVQLMSLVTIAASPVGVILAHMPPTEEMKAAAGGEAGAMLSAIFGAAAVEESVESCVKDVLHVICSLTSIVAHMQEEGVIDQSRSQKNYEKLTAAMHAHAMKRNVH